MNTKSLSLGFRFNMTRYAAIACLLAANGCVAEESSVEEESAIASDSQEIVGGTDASIFEFPWQISFQSAAGQHFCGGSILNARYILTAAHCVSLGPDGTANNGSIRAPVTVRVAAGASKLSNMAISGQIRAVEDIIPVPGYVDSESGKDIALLRLSIPLTLNSSTVAAITNATAADANAGLTAPGVMSTVTGWGRLSEGGPLSDTLQKVSVPIISEALAATSYPNMTPDQLAAGNFFFGGQDSCQGDSGGPLMVTKNGLKIVAGVVSYGQGCARAQFPGMYARVSSFEGFINKIKNMAPTTLLNQTAQSGVVGAFKHFPVVVPAGTTALNAHLSGGVGDADLYVHFGSPSTDVAFNCRPFLDSSNESCSIGTPAAGTWYVSIRAFSNYSLAALKVTKY